nr:hypothetical protein GCM10020093_043730 [Planobispora longispora]
MDALIRSGVILDEAMVYWLARPSHHLPTVEVRVADVCATAEEAVAYAAIVRALVATVLRDIRSGTPPPRPPEALLEAAYWRAARDGLEGEGLDPVTGTPVPAWRLVDGLMARIGPALAAAGDLPMVTERLFLLRCLGSGRRASARCTTSGATCTTWWRGWGVRPRPEPSPPYRFSPHDGLITS